MDASVATRSKMSDGTGQIWIGMRRADVRRRTVDEGVQDGHGAVGDTSVGVHLLEDWR